jgi:hypothetical protein
MTSHRPLCFVSYCRSDTNPDALRSFIDHLNDVAAGHANFVSGDTARGGREAQGVQASDATLLLLSPEYKNQVHDQTGVFNDFTYIMNRRREQIVAANTKTDPDQYDEEILQKGRILIGSPFPVVPIIFSGTKARSCPDEFTGLTIQDVTDYRVILEGGRVIRTNNTNKKYDALIHEIVGIIRAHHASRSESTRQSFERNLSVFFRETKDERSRGDPTFEAAFEQVFVKTTSFERVENQSASFLVGRKGSGKSTIIHKLEKKYAGVIELSVNELNLESYYHTTPSSLRRDLGKVIKRTEFFQCVWNVFLHVACAKTFMEASDSSDVPKVNETDRKEFQVLLGRVVGTSQDSERNYLVAMFGWSYSKVCEVIEERIQMSRDEFSGFGYDLALVARVDVVRNLCIGAEVAAALGRTMNGDGRRFLFWLDGFDTAFEEFRVATERLSADDPGRVDRTLFEIDWLRGLMAIVLNDRTGIIDRLDFCVIVPKDRFLEVRSEERDAYQYINRVHEIRWSGVELAIMLRKRLEQLAGQWTAKGGRWQDRLNLILRSAFGYLPQNTQTTIAGRQYEMHIFLDVLRHTFWRPREVLIYFAKILAVLEHLKEAHVSITAASVSKCISDMTREIITSEFLNEFQRHCRNLRQIVDGFRRCTQTLSLKQVQDIIGPVGFEFVDRAEPARDFDVKIKFLFEIGFLGLLPNKWTAERMKLLQPYEQFYFNADRDSFAQLAGDGYANCQFIVHPIFCEFLDLDTESQALTLNVTFKSLIEHEAHVIKTS